MAVLPLDPVVKIIVNLSPRSAVRSGFNVALIVGPSKAISLEARVKMYSSVTSMEEDGFETDSPEHKAAALYFMQSTGPSQLAVGRWDEENETMTDAVKACRAKNREWYACIPLSATPEQITDLAAHIESVTPAALLCYTTKDRTLLETMKGLGYRRSFGQYSENVNAVAGIIGWAMGANTGLRGSAFTLSFKRLTGIAVDDLDENTVSEIQKANGNYYINRGAQYDLFERGTMADGTWFDEMINLDMLVNDLQLSIMDLLASEKKVPQTEGGVNLIKTVMLDPLEKAVRTGFIAGGIWKGSAMLGLSYGDAIEKGYLVQSEPVAEQSQANRDSRIAPPIYVAVKLAGAIHSVVVQIDVNR